MFWEKCYTFLAHMRTAQRLGFVFGASQVIGFNKRTIENPGASCLIGFIVGCVYGLGFDILGSFCTPHMAVCLNGMVIGATVYKQFNNWSNPPLTFDNPVINISINNESEKSKDN